MALDLTLLLNCCIVAALLFGIEVVRAAKPRADPYEHPFNAAQDDSENREAQCKHLMTCDRCTMADGCGWCVDRLRSGDGSTTQVLAACVASNRSFPGAVPNNRKCNAGYHHLICPCPNQCSGHGTCQPSGDCLCFHAFEGGDCSKERDTKMNPAVVIPISIAVVGIAVGAIIAIHVKQTSQARSSGFVDKEKESDGDLEYKDEEDDDPARDDIQLLSKRAGFSKLRVQ